MTLNKNNVIVPQIKGVWSNDLDEIIFGVKKGLSSLKDTEVTAISFDELP